MIFLGKKTTKKNFQDLYGQIEILKFATTHLEIANFHPSIQLITHQEMQQSILFYMPNFKEKKIAQKLSIPYYTCLSWEKKIQKQIANLQKICYFILLKFLLVKNKPNKTKGLLVVKVDAIGDYLLFRNFIPHIYNKYGKFTLIANQACREIIEKYDLIFLQEVIYIDRKKFIKNIIYAQNVLQTIGKNSYSLLINPTYSRDFLSEEIVKITSANQKLAPFGDQSNLSERQKCSYDKNYTFLYPSSPKIMFEFFRNLEFFRHILNKNLNVQYKLNAKDTYKVFQKFSLKKPYSVLFIGASAQFRKWGNDHFVQIANFLYSTFNENIVICGGKEDLENGNYIQHELKKSSINCLNLCGQTSLIDLIGVVYNGNHLISNETSCVHIAHAIRHNKIFVVSNGNHLYRFTPYPKGIGGESVEIFHPTIQKNLDTYAIISNLLQQQSHLNINHIRAQQVINAIRIKYNS